MIDPVVGRLPVVLVVDPVATSRHMMWRLLNGAFGVIEAPDAQRAREWIASRPDIDALVVQNDLPDAHGHDLVKGLDEAHVTAATRALVVRRPVDLHRVVISLARWFFARDARSAEALLREAERLAP
jgi:DNA-binding NtrC family response regulator